MRLKCKCGKLLTVSDDALGKRVRCPACGETLEVKSIQQASGDMNSTEGRAESQTSTPATGEELPAWRVAGRPHHPSSGGTGVLIVLWLLVGATLTFVALSNMSELSGWRRETFVQLVWVIVAICMAVASIIAVLWAQTNRKLQFLAEPRSLRKQCPDCAEWIAAEANVCSHCGRRSPVAETESLYVTIMNSKDADTRYLALAKVVRVPRSVAISILTLGLVDPQVELRQFAANTIRQARFRDAPFIPVLVSRLEEESAPMVVDALVKCLRAYGEEAVLGLLELVRRSPKSRAGKLAQRLLDDINSSAAS
jgi:hypothetical protein